MIVAAQEFDVAQEVPASRRSGSTTQATKQQVPIRKRGAATRGIKRRSRLSSVRETQQPVEPTTVTATGQRSDAGPPPESHYEVKSNGDILTGKHVTPPEIPAGLTAEQAEEFVRVAGQAYNLASTYFPAVVARASGLPAELIDARVGARYLENVITEIDAADSLEKQLVEQICALHLTFGQLSLKAAGMQDTDAFRVMMEVALRCQAEHRRTCLALVQYRLAKQKLAAGVGGRIEGAATDQSGKSPCGRRR